MPRRAVWADYHVKDTYMKAVSQHGKQVMVEYTRFSCPYESGCCGLPIETPSSRVVNNKSDACRHHLLNCHGVAVDGSKASDDPRVAEARAPVVGTAVPGGESAVIATLQANHAEQRQAQRRQHEELMAALTGRLEKKAVQLATTYARGNLSPPRSDDDDDALRAKVAALDERSKLEMAADVTQRAGASPPRNGEGARAAAMRGLKRCAEAAELDVCGICLTRPPDTVMVPCFCLSACKACWDRWVRTRLEREGRRARCTKCNAVVAQAQLVYRR